MLTEQARAYLRELQDDVCLNRQTEDGGLYDSPREYLEAMRPMMDECGFCGTRFSFWRGACPKCGCPT